MFLNRAVLVALLSAWCCLQFDLVAEGYFFRRRLTEDPDCGRNVVSKDYT